MAKDPAFLFYSKDYFEGTRLMTPEERACYVDLMIMQHQQGVIPDDPKKLTLYCSGISQETVEAVLKLKFKLGLNGWFSQRLQDVIDERASNAKINSMKGAVGQFWKKVNSLFSRSDYNKIRALYKEYSLEDIYNLFCKNKLVEAELIVQLKQALEDADENVNENKDVIKDKKKGYGEKEKVKLTDDEYSKLIDKFDKPSVDSEILALENYIVNGKGKKYKDHYLVLNNWLNKRKDQSNGSTESEYERRSREREEELRKFVEG